MKEFIKGIVFCLFIIATLIGIKMLAEVISKTIKPEIIMFVIFPIGMLLIIKKMLKEEV